MGASVILKVIEGGLTGRQYPFREPATCMIGRAEDCNIRLDGGSNPGYISRYHCLLDIAPPNVHVRDYHSKNGTFVNGRRIGQQDAALNDNDELRVGDTLFRIVIEQASESEGANATLLFKDAAGEATLMFPTPQAATPAPKSATQRPTRTPAASTADAASTSFSPRHFGFRRKPFQGNGLDFLRAYADYETAYARLLDSIRLGHKLILLTGESGTGKSLLLGNLVHDPTVGLTSVLCKSPLSYDELLSWICEDLQLVVAGNERPHKLQALMEYSKTHPEAGIILIVDNARQLDSANMRNTLRLSRLGLTASIVLADTPGLTRQLSYVHGDEQGGDSNLLTTATLIELKSMNPAQTADFIQKQIQVAGGNSEKLFNQAALERIANLTQGIPRSINALCDRSLMIAEGSGKTQIAVETVNKAAVQLDLMEPVTSMSNLKFGGESTPLVQANAEKAVPAEHKESSITPADDLPAIGDAPRRYPDLWFILALGVVIAVGIAIGYWLYFYPTGAH